MKKLVLILLLFTPVWAFTQTHTFTEKEVVKISENWNPWKSLAAHLLWDHYRKIKNKD